MGFRIRRRALRVKVRGSTWNGETMLFTDIPSSCIMRLDPDSGECTEYRTETQGTNRLMFDI